MTKITSDAQALAYLDTPDPKMQELRAYLAARLASTSPAPDGWVLVPREPTAEMYIAGAKAVDGRRQNRAQICYAAMIAAAPQPVVEKDNG